MVKNNSALVVGAGISGSSIAYHLNKKGWDVTIVDQAKESSLSIYANPAVCVNPNVMISDQRFNRLMCSSISYVWKLINLIGLDESSASQVGSIHLFEHKEGIDRFTRLIKNNPGLKSFITLIDQNQIRENYNIKGCVGFYFNSGGWINPEDFCRTLVSKTNIRKEFGSKVTEVECKEDVWHIKTNDKKEFKAKNIVFCSAGDIANYAYFSHLDFDQYRGQIDWVNSETKQKLEILSNNGYVIPSVKKKTVVGSSYEKNNCSYEASDADTKSNLNKLNALLPSLNNNLLSGSNGSWVGQRAASFDRKPYVGRVLDMGGKSRLANKIDRSSLVWKKGLYINACYGSRGFSFAPLSSLSLANLMDQSLNSDDKFLLGYLNPERRFFRGMGLKKQGIEFKL